MGGCRECRAPEIRVKATEGAEDLNVQALKDSPAYGAWNVRIVATGTGEALPGPVTCGWCCRSVVLYNQCTVVGYHRYNTKAELLLLNTIWALQSLLTNYFYPQQKLVSKVRDGAKVSKKYDIATTPHHHAERHDTVTAEDKAILADTYTGINPAAVQRQIQALTAELLTITTSKAGPAKKAPATRASSDESTNQSSRAS